MADDLSSQLRGDSSSLQSSISHMERAIQNSLQNIGNVLQIGIQNLSRAGTVAQAGAAAGGAAIGSVAALASAGAAHMLSPPLTLQTGTFARQAFQDQGTIGQALSTKDYFKTLLYGAGIGSTPDMPGVIPGEVGFEAMRRSRFFEQNIEESFGLLKTPIGAMGLAAAGGMFASMPFAFGGGIIMGSIASNASTTLGEMQGTRMAGAEIFRGLSRRAGMRSTFEQDMSFGERFAGLSTAMTGILSGGELTNVVTAAAEIGAFDSAGGNAETISRQVRGLATQFNSFMKIMRLPDVQTAIGAMQELSKMGVPATQLGAAGQQIAGLAAGAGMSPASLVSIASTGAQVFQQAGMLPFAGLMQFGQSMVNMNALQGAGLFSNQLIARMGGQRNAVGAMFGSNLQSLASPTGQAMMLSEFMGAPLGTAAIAGGVVGVQAPFSAAAGNISPADYLKFQYFQRSQNEQRSLLGVVANSGRVMDTVDQIMATNPGMSQNDALMMSANIISGGDLNQTQMLISQTLGTGRIADRYVESQVEAAFQHKFLIGEEDKTQRSLSNAYQTSLKRFALRHMGASGRFTEGDAITGVRLPSGLSTASGAFGGSGFVGVNLEGAMLGAGVGGVIGLAAGALGGPLGGALFATAGSALGGAVGAAIGGVGTGGIGRLFSGLAQLRRARIAGPMSGYSASLDRALEITDQRLASAQSEMSSHNVQLENVSLQFERSLSFGRLASKFHAFVGKNPGMADPIQAFMATAEGRNAGSIVSSALTGTGLSGGDVATMLPQLLTFGLSATGALGSRYRQAAFDPNFNPYMSPTQQYSLMSMHQDPSVSAYGQYKLVLEQSSLIGQDLNQRIEDQTKESIRTATLGGAYTLAGGAMVAGLALAPVTFGASILIGLAAGAVGAGLGYFGRKGAIAEQSELARDLVAGAPAGLAQRIQKMGPFNLGGLHGMAEQLVGSQGGDTREILVGQVMQELRGRFVTGEQGILAPYRAKIDKLGQSAGVQQYLLESAGLSGRDVANLRTLERRVASASFDSAGLGTMMGVEGVMGGEGGGMLAAASDKFQSAAQTFADAVRTDVQTRKAGGTSPLDAIGGLGDFLGL